LSENIILAFLTFIVALIYSSVGHGGASGYLAVLSFFQVPHGQMATSALCLNLLVAGMAFWNFFKASHFSWRLTWPFCLTSIPFAFIGGFLKVPSAVYSFLLAAVLMFAAGRLLLEFGRKAKETSRLPSYFTSFLLGGSIGILSGVVGVGGGIFLSPILLFFRWADPKRTAATSAFFILVNSFAGLLGRSVQGHFQITEVLIYMVTAAFIGGIVGSRLGANHFSGKWLKRILACVLLIAASKLLHALFA